MKKMRLLSGLALLLAALLSGCGSGLRLVVDPQELYTLPELPAKYTELNGQLSAILEAGAEYAAPTSGANIQPVQMTDLDGDGREEAVAFFRKADDEKPLKIYIFSALGGGYQQTAVIEGSGTAVYSVVYSDMDGDGRTELLVGWKVNPDLQALSVYTVSTAGAEELLRSVSYVKYAAADLDQDQRQELVVLRADEEGDGVAEYYGWQDGSLAPRSLARVSMTMAELSQQGRVRLGTLREEIPALFVTGVTDQAGAVTDILAVRNGELSNIVLSELTGVSGEIAPFCYLYPSDINGDGLTEVPSPVLGGPEDSFQRVDWRSFDAAGGAETVLSTYHNVEDGWYLHLPEGWPERILTERSSASSESTVTFFALGERGEAAEPVLKITAITGAGREVRATRGNRFLLSRQTGSIYTAELLEGNERWEYGLTADEVRAAFCLILPEWTTGDN